MRDAAIQRVIAVVHHEEKVWRIEPMTFGVNYKHTDTCLLKILFGSVEHAPTKKKTKTAFG